MTKRVWLGQIPYGKGLEEQDRCWQTARAGVERFLLGCEHNTVVTMGARGNPDEDMLLSKAELTARGIDYHETRRGGQAVMHNPGQLVIYPILNLKSCRLGIRQFVRRLETVSIAVLNRHGLNVERRGEEPGLFSTKGKVVFIGVHVSQFTTRHGLAINVTNETDLFALIRSCGVTRQALDRVATHSPLATAESLFQEWCDEWDRIDQTHRLLDLSRDTQ